jgi:hypothetical protein
VLLGNHLFYDGNQNQSYDQYLKRGTVFPNTSGWQEILIGTTAIAPGSHQIRFSASLNAEVFHSEFLVDMVILKPQNK